MSNVVFRFLSSLAVALSVALSVANQGWTQGPSTNYAMDRDAENALDMEDYNRAISIFRNRLSAKGGPQSQEGYLRTGLGEAYLWQGDFSSAAKEFKKAYNLIDKSEPAASDLRARVLDDMSWLQEAQGDQSGAINSCKQALAALQGITGAEPVHLSGVLEHMGYLMRKGGYYAEAANYYSQALNLSITKYGANSLRAADLKERLASVQRRLGNAAGASNLYAQAMNVKLNSNALFTPYSPHPYNDTVTYRYYPGVPNCALQSSNGCAVEAINVGGVTIAASVQPSTKEMSKRITINVNVINDTQQLVQFLSKPPILTVMTPKAAIAHLVDPTKLADTIENKGNKSAKWVRFWGADATTPVTSTYFGNGGGYWGYPPVYSYNGIAPIVNRSGNMTTVTTQVPDYAAQARALQKAANIQQNAQELAQTIRSSSIGPTTLQPGGRTAGSLYFDVDKMNNAFLQIPVGNAVIEFEFPPAN